MLINYKLFFLFSLLVVCIALLPYVNGLGCDFKYTMKSQHDTYNGVCKYGLMTSFHYSNLTGDISYGRYFFGFSGEYAFFFLLNKNNYSISGQNDNGRNVDQVHVFSFLDDDYVTVPMYKCLSKGRCYLLYGGDIENVYSFDYSGRIAIYSGE